MTYIKYTFLKGQENLSLQTIAKLSEALNMELITFPKFLFDQPINKVFKTISSKKN
jgi:hypothetical protein